MSEKKHDGTGPTAEVSDDVIQAALDSVNQRSSTSGSKENENASGRIEIELTGEAEPGEKDPTAKEVLELRAQLDLSVERARETLDRLKDTHERYLRASADLENYKKRATREKEEVERFGVQKLLKDLLPVVDNLDRALSHAETTNPLTAGVQATRRIFEDTIGRYGVKAFSAVGQVFDPARHEAMQQVETLDSPAGTVVSELVRGYMLHDRLIRPALVAVAMAPTEELSAVSAQVAPATSNEAPADGSGGAGKVS